MMASVGPAVQRRRLQVELRQLRERQSKTQREVASDIGWSLSKLIRIETGQVGLSLSDLRALLAEYGVGDPEVRSRLEALAREGRKQQWGRYRDVLNPDFLAYLGFEGSAATIRQAEPQVLPGLLQTSRYARAVIAGVGGAEVSSSTVDRQVEVRMKRQEVFKREAPPEMFFILDESALRRPVGGRAVMVDQLNHLARMAALRHVHLRVIPLERGAHPGLRGAFVLLELPGLPGSSNRSRGAMLFLESSQTSLITKDNAAAIATYEQEFKFLQTLALPEGKTVKLITDIAASLRRAALLKRRRRRLHSNGHRGGHR
ncbi:helix-turn-helix domain-containing protein [Micromonospora chalcea]|uniref:helix-turn-helix domain-containing protein n=1 Tax=Micromonospora chalcea TaxID=1874 RepID=UPI0037C9653D